MKELSVFLGGVDQLPFSNVPTPEEALSLLGSTVRLSAFGTFRDAFLKEYGIWYDAFLMVRERFTFYLCDALPHPALYDRIGSRDRNLRLVLAMYHCIVKATEIKEKLDGMVKEYLVKYIRSVACQKQGIEPIDARPRDFPLSRCELTGVCVCTNLGGVPSYLNGCLSGGDTTLLLPYEEPFDIPF